MAKKKSNGEGTIYQIKSGWASQITIGHDPITGKLTRKYFSANTKKALILKIDEYKSSRITGTYIEPSKLTVKDWLELWLETYKKNNVSPKTYDEIEYQVNSHIIPSLGHILLQSLKTEDIQKMYNNKFDNGKLDGSGGLSAKTIKHFHTALRQALNKALDLGYIPKNPSVNCELPKDIKLKKEYLSIEEQVKVFKSINSTDRYELAILFDFGTGLRQGELIALTWNDIDFDKENINVNKSYSTSKNRDLNISNKYVNTIKAPKNKSSNREIPIPKSFVPLLKKHKLNMIEENLAAGRNNDLYNIVFQSRNGTHLNPKNIDRSWRKLLRKTQIEHIPLHGIRHSFASRLAEAGVNPAVAQQLLGHSSISTTLTIYTHISQDLKRSAAIAIDNLFNPLNENEVNEEVDLYRVLNQNNTGLQVGCKFLA